MDRFKLHSVQIFIFILLLIELGCQNKTEIVKEEYYEWKVSANAPKNYPAEIYVGYLGKGDKGLTMRNGSLLQNGWGLKGSANSGTNLPIPNQLDIIWMSYLENQFYEGHFNLDTIKIKQIIETGYEDNVEDGVKIFHDFHFIINLAPQGNVGIWMLGTNGFQREIGYYKCKKTEVDWVDFVPMGNQNRNEFVKTMLKDVAENVLNQFDENSSFDQWKEYRKPFTWKIVMPDNFEIDFLKYNCFNGEQYRGKSKVYKIEENFKTIALPKKIIINWKDDKLKTSIAKFTIKDSEFPKIIKFLEKKKDKIKFLIEPIKRNNKYQVNLTLQYEYEKLDIELEPYKIYFK